MSDDDLTKRQAGTPVLKLGKKTVVMKPGTSAKAGLKQLDVVFVFDTTGSMNDKIDALVRCMSDLVDELGRLRLDWRVAVVPFGDLTIPGDRIVDDRPFVDSVAAATQELRSMARFSGGGNEGESSAQAMLAAARKTYRPRAVKVLVLVTDEPSLGGTQELLAVDGALNSLDAACFTVSPNLDYFRRWAEHHGGQWREVGVQVDTTAIVELFRSLVAQIALVADSVHRLGGGSVKAYLERGGDA